MPFFRNQIALIMQNPGSTPFISRTIYLPGNTANTRHPKSPALFRQNLQVTAYKLLLTYGQSTYLAFATRKSIASIGFRSDAINSLLSSERFLAISS